MNISEMEKVVNTFNELGIFPFSKFVLDDKFSIISTGSFLLDKAIGIGGWPIGKIIEFFGVDSSGKTTLALHAVAEAQKQNKTVVYLDLENTLNSEWAKKIGVDIDKLLVARPESGEKTFDLINKLLKTRKVDLIVVDSVASLVPIYEFGNNMDDHTMGLHARLMSKGLRIMQSLMINGKTTVIFINQVREKIGNGFIPVITTTGGRALKYAASIRVEVKKCEAIKDSLNSVVGFETKCIVVKNKFGAPLTIAKSAIYFDSGFDIYHEVINELISSKILIKKGAWIEYLGKNLAQGIIQLRKKLRENNELFNELKSKLTNV